MSIFSFHLALVSCSYLCVQCSVHTVHYELLYYYLVTMHICSHKLNKVLRLALPETGAIAHMDMSTDRDASHTSLHIYVTPVFFYIYIANHLAGGN
jgi:hypothetical protein